MSVAHSFARLCGNAPKIPTAPRGPKDLMQVWFPGVHCDVRGGYRSGIEDRVHIYNYSKVPSRMLVRAEQEATRIFQRIAIETKWVDCPLTEEQRVRNSACDVPGAPSRFTLRLLSNTLAERLPLRAQAPLARLAITVWRCYFCQGTLPRYLAKSR